MHADLDLESDDGWTWELVGVAAERVVDRCISEGRVYLISDAEGMQ